ncbi:hypothetical protein H8356DRAFT_1305122 [Neocallimastix lanati (nom. inval.)]|nr:hypothetical protein H8356DRAFT_1305122 [Neocallimastix sp. JGI-2020a]
MLSLTSKYLIVIALLLLTIITLSTAYIDLECGSENGKNCPDNYCCSNRTCQSVVDYSTCTTESAKENVVILMDSSSVNMDENAIKRLNEIFSEVINLFPGDVDVPYLIFADNAPKVKFTTSDDDLKIEIKDSDGSNFTEALQRANEFLKKYGKNGKNGKPDNVIIVTAGIPKPSGTEKDIATVVVNAINEANKLKQSDTTIYVININEKADAKKNIASVGTYIVEDDYNTVMKLLSSDYENVKVYYADGKVKIDGYTKNSSTGYYRTPIGTGNGNLYNDIVKKVMDGTINKKCNIDKGCDAKFGFCNDTTGPVEEEDQPVTHNKLKNLARDIDLEGQGTWNEPFLIKSSADLQRFAENVDKGTSYAGKYISLTQDIDISDVKNFNSIGTEDGVNLFEGTFDGNNFSITGLTIKAKEASYEGLFTALKDNAVVKNLKIENASIEASPNFDLKIGIIAGELKKASRVYNCHVSGTIIEKSASMPLTVGGIVGNMALKSEVNSCSARVKINIETTEGVTCDVGGIAGLTKMNAKVINSAAKGEINAKGNTAIKAGGIVGNAMGITENVVSAMSLKSDGKKGSILGYADDFGKTSNLYTSNTEINAMGNKPDKAESKFTEETLNKNISALHRSYSTLSFRSWEPAYDTIMPLGQEWHETTINSAIFDGGSGTIEDPYKIKTKKQLIDFANSLEEEILYDNKYIEVIADIDISDVENWEPIGGSQFSFNGVFDGKGHTINGLKEGTEENPRKLSKNIEDFSNALGFFGTLGVNAIVKNIRLTNVAMFAYREDASFVGGIVGYMNGYSDASTSQGAIIDNCYVQGKIVSTTKEKNTYVGGIAARQFKGAIINCHVDVDLKSKVEFGESVASVGGITGMTNRGLVANCYAKGKFFGSMVRDIENEIEGMSSVGGVVGVDAGELVNSYAKGDTISEFYSVYTGAITGWVTGVGKAYQSYFDIEKVMIIDGHKESEIQAYGTKAVGGINDEGEAYEGGVVGDLYSYNSSTYKDLANKLNENFKHFGVNIQKYGLKNNALRNWTYTNNEVTFTNEYADITYVQPEYEKAPVISNVMKDGVWYGRDNDAVVTLKVVVKDGKIIKEAFLTGSKNDEKNYERALARVTDKAIYGDKTGYGRGDTTVFAGGQGTKENPYLIENEEQLRYIAEAINADETWDGIYFKQTTNIKLSDKDWLPIGTAIKAKIKGNPVIYSAYPFRGSYDGANFTITGLKIGSRLNPASEYTAAMFGFTGGDYESNLTYGDEVYKVVLKNIHLKDVFINNEVPYDTYTAGLVGTGQNGVFIDNCSVTGKISVKADDIASRAAGLASSMLRGAVTNCYTDVSINAITEEGDVYAGGMFSVTNRINVINSYTLGNVYGNANTNNKVHIGGFTGMNGGFQYNCYAMGNVTSNRPTIDIGIMDGRIANIAYDRYCYFNSDAKLTENGKVVNSVYTGADGTGSSKDVTFGKTKKEIGSKDFIDLLNNNRKNVISELDISNEELGGVISIYYEAGPEGLFTWKNDSGIAVFANSKIPISIF